MVDNIPPILSMSSPTSGSEVQSSTVATIWIALDAGSDIDHYEVRLDEGTWINIMTSTSYNFTGVNDGSHTFQVKVVDGIGNFGAVAVNFTISTEIVWLDLTTIAIIGTAVVAVMAVAYLILRGRKPSISIPT